MSTKKVYVEMLQFLESHKDSKVSDILKHDEFQYIIEARKNATTVLRDDKENVVAIFCYYHKQWELIKEVEYGKKASSATGLNTMCKVGVNKWTKQQSDAKKAKAALLDEVAEGNLDPKDIPARIDEIEKQKDRIDMKDAPKGTKEMPKL